MTSGSESSGSRRTETTDQDLGHETSWALCAQVGFLDAGVFGQGLGLTGKDNLADFEHVGSVADLGVTVTVSSPWWC